MIRWIWVLFERKKENCRGDKIGVM